MGSTLEPTDSAQDFFAHLTAPIAGPSSLSGQGGGGAFDFPLDPSLFGEGTAEGGDESFGEEDSGDDDEEGEGSEREGYSDSEEEEYRAAQQGGVKRRKAKLPPKQSAKSKGKQRAHDVEPEEGEDIGRLITAIRDQATSSVGGRTALEREFDRSIEEEMDALDGTKKGKKPKGRRAIADMEPSLEVKALLGRANVHYASGEHEPAEELLTEVVRIDPSIRTSWYMLSTIAEEKGDTEKSVMFRIVALHLSSAKSAAKDWADLGHTSRDIGLLQQAIYCFTQAIKGDKSDVESMWDRAVLLKMSGSDKQAITAFTALLKIIPHDPGVLRELVPLLAVQQEYHQASQLYLDALEYFQDLAPHVTDPLEISSFGIEDLEALSDFLTLERAYDKVITIVKSGTRWLQGRERETGWDALDDDREYDTERKVRPGWEKDARFLEQAEIYPLDIRLRVRLGIARLKQDRLEEAKRHFTIVLEEDVAENPVLFGAVADAYLERGMHVEALEIFQDMCENEETNGVAAWMKVGECQLAMGDLQGSQECYDAVVEAEPDNFTAKMQLAKIFEMSNEPARALAMINDVIDARQRLREAGGDAALGVSGFDPRGLRKKGDGVRLTKGQRANYVADQLATEELRQQEFLLAVQKLAQLESKVDAGDLEARAEWLEVATHLVDAFRETRQLFPVDSKKKFVGVLARAWKRRGDENDIESQADQMASRLKRSMQTDAAGSDVMEETTYRGVTFDHWLNIIIKYAFLLTRNDEYEAAKETLEHVQLASVFKQSNHRSIALRFARAACALRAHDATEAVVALRWVWLHHAFESQPLRLLQSLLSSGVEASDSLNEPALQKFVIRQIKQSEAVVKGAEVKFSARGVSIMGPEEKDQHDDDEGSLHGGSESDLFRPTKSNPLQFAAYGMLLMVSRSWQSAIIYLLRAYEIAPKEPVLNLCLAVAYLSRAMSRQSDNRQHQIAQGLAFLSQYRVAKGPSQEVEYNFGRAFHHLGLQSLAVKHYEAVLALAEAERMAVEPSDDRDTWDEPDDFARVAAYNLSSLFLVSGSSESARRVAARWLAV